MTNKFLIAQLVQIENQAMTLVQQVRILREEVEAFIGQESEAEPEEDEEGNCLHPSDCRQAAPSMGHGGAFYCTRCKKRVREA